MKKKKREFESSELLKAFAKIHGFENKLIAFEIKDFLKEYLDKQFYEQITSVDLQKNTLTLRIASPLVKNDLHLRKSFLLKKLQQKFGENILNELVIS